MRHALVSHEAAKLTASCTCSACKLVAVQRLSVTQLRSTLTHTKRLKPADSAVRVCLGICAAEGGALAQSGRHCCFRLANTPSARQSEQRARSRPPQPPSSVPVPVLRRAAQSCACCRTTWRGEATMSAQDCAVRNEDAQRVLAWNTRNVTYTTESVERGRVFPHAAATQRASCARKRKRLRWLARRRSVAGGGIQIRICSPAAFRSVGVHPSTRA